MTHSICLELKRNVCLSSFLFPNEIRTLSSAFSTFLIRKFETNCKHKHWRSPFFQPLSSLLGRVTPLYTSQFSSLILSLSFIGHLLNSPLSPPLSCPPSSPVLPFFLIRAIFFLLLVVFTAQYFVLCLHFPGSGYLSDVLCTCLSLASLP